MPSKILVPTDFSVNSKAGIRFAIQLASQNKSSLVFYHCMELLKPMRWTKGQFDLYVKKQLEDTRLQLIQFVEKVYDHSAVEKNKYECVVEEGSDPKKSVIDYAVSIGASAICMGTRGAGKIRKFIGTNSSGILSTSPVPVLVIPNGYRRSPITNILYASDLDDTQSELKRVAEFATPLKANVVVYHYTEKMEDPETRRKLVAVQQRHQKDGVSFIFQAMGNGQVFSQYLDADIRKSKASVAVLFTNQKRGWVDKIFEPSKAAEVSFNSKVPLMIFAKG